MVSAKAFVAISETENRVLAQPVYNYESRMVRGIRGGRVENVYHVTPTQWAKRVKSNDENRFWRIAKTYQNGDTTIDTTDCFDDAGDMARAAIMCDDYRAVSLYAIVAGEHEEIAYKYTDAGGVVRYSHGLYL